MTAFPQRLDPALHPWMTADGVRTIFAAIGGAGGTARFVGGAVRDALLGRVVGDVDMAVTLPPEAVTAALDAAGIKVVPTGIAHGTVTAVAEGRGYEITTLRYDVETDGRRAKVAFTDDWQADAARRDFTFNALYADADGAVYDYFGGRDDLAAGRVRFIGDAEARIREDVLRILRFFRFYAWFGRGAADAAGVAACARLAGLLPQLSAERVWREIGKLLLAPDPFPALCLMRERGVLGAVLPEATELGRLQRLVAVEEENGGADAVRRLTAALGGEVAAAAVAVRLKMARRDEARLQLLAQLPERLRGRYEARDLRQVLYDCGEGAVRDALLLLAADEAVPDLGAALAVVAAWESPRLPVQGADVVALGVAAGPQVGKVLQSVEDWWRELDFRPARQECLEALRGAVE